jgi:hypothetical protein
MSIENYDLDSARKAAKEAGYTDEQFDAHIATLNKPKDTAKPTGVQEFAEPEMKNVQIGNGYEWLYPAAIGAGGALAAKAITPIFKSLSEKVFGSKTEAPRIEPTFEAKPTATVEPTKNLSPLDAELLRKYEAQQAAKTQPPMMGQPGFQPSAPVAPPSVQSLDQAFATSVAPPVVQTAPAAPVAPVQPTPAATEPKKTGGRPTKQAVAAEMEGKVFKEGFGGADNYLEKQMGPDIRRFMKDEFNQGKPYGGGQAAMDKAYADIKKYDTWLKENIPVQTLNREERKAMGVPPPKDYPVLGKAMKVGGAAGLLMTAGQAANAKEVMGSIGEALLPLGMTPSDLAPGTLTKKQLDAYKEAQKLGSPYRSVPPR